MDLYLVSRAISIELLLFFQSLVLVLSYGFMVRGRLGKGGGSRMKKEKKGYHVCFTRTRSPDRARH